ncbi:MAG: RNB domain-containing ribonuclease [Opitutaceae bacterium]|nr:RNB domain-containing ribonuclease [Opitutaceae bacterium]
MFQTPTTEVLQRIAERAMRERGIEPDFPPEALAELSALEQLPRTMAGGVRDLRRLPWCSIDNEETRDLDQLTVAEALGDGAARVLIAIADVASLVAQHSAIDLRAQQNTTSVYTVAKVFPMLPERLSTDLTSMNLGCDRRAMVVAIDFASDGSVRRSDFHEALVHNQARLNYADVAAWLEGEAPAPAAIDAVPVLADNLRLQDRVARQTRALRFTRGALTFETVQARPVFVGGELKDLSPEKPNRAKQLIEDFMIAANGVTAEFLATRGYASIRRVVRTPKRWDRIVALAAERGASLPDVPEPKALEAFLRAAKAQAPAEFPDLSLSVIKLLGAGEYALELPGQPGLGHFGLAVKDYAHSTAPNRRFPDLITQRLLKAANARAPAPYSNAELETLAAHCTEQEDDARKVERQVAKSAAAMLLMNRIGAEFDALVTGASDKGTWVRIFHPVVEGRLTRGFAGRQVGEKLRVRLLHANVDRGFLDFGA